MLGLSPSDYILRAVSKVHTNDLEQTLLVSEKNLKIMYLYMNYERSLHKFVIDFVYLQALPFSDALKLLSNLKDWSSNPDKV